jgi:hypothetical protein
MRYPFPSLRRSSLKTGSKTRATPRNGTHNDLPAQTVWRHSYIPKRNVIREEFRDGFATSALLGLAGRFTRSKTFIRPIPAAYLLPKAGASRGYAQPGENLQTGERQTPRIYSASLSTFHTYRNSSLLDVAIASFR